jgi:ferrochelatase
MPAASPEPYDALLLVSFGGPEGPDDVLPFLQNVTRGRGVPPERLAEVAEHYLAVGGVSPINAQNRALQSAIAADLAANSVDLPVYWGNRNWSPYLADTLRQMRADGVERAAVFVTSAYASYSGCRQYREDLATAAEADQAVTYWAPRLDKLRHYFNHPGFVEPMADAVEAAVRGDDAEGRETDLSTHLVFVTHSIPTAMAAASGPTGGAYVDQHRDVSALLAARVSKRLGFELPWQLVYCSRSGPPSQPWLEPDVNAHLRALSADGVRRVVVVPVGFVSDHMEVRFDLDTEAAETARDLGLAFVRADTVGTDPRFVAMVRELLLERAAVERGEPVPRPCEGALGVSPDTCPVDCCVNLRESRPALAGADAASAAEAAATT